MHFTLKMRNRPLDEFGGEGGIRTPGTLRHTRFRVGHIRPLCHLSSKNGLYLLFAQKWQFNTGKISVPFKFSKFTRLPESEL